MGEEQGQGVVGEEEAAAPVGLPAGGELGEGELEEGFADEGAADVEDRGRELGGLPVWAHGFDLVEGGGDAFFRADVGAYPGGFAAGFGDLGDEGFVVGRVTGEHDDGVAGGGCGVSCGGFTRFDLIEEGIEPQSPM